MAHLSGGPRLLHHSLGRQQAAGVPVWRDTRDLWPGQDWRLEIRTAITDGSLAFIACFSRVAAAKERSYQREELLLAVEQLRVRSPEQAWFMPVRLDDLELPRSRGYLILGETLEEGGPCGSSREVPARVPS